MHTCMDIGLYLRYWTVIHAPWKSVLYSICTVNFKGKNVKSQVIVTKTIITNQEWTVEHFINSVFYFGEKSNWRNIQFKKKIVYSFVYYHMSNEHILKLRFPNFSGCKQRNEKHCNVHVIYSKPLQWDTITPQHFQWEHCFFIVLYMCSS